MDKTYNPQQIETEWYQTWENTGYFKASGQGEPYCIMLPPPNVTGSLHMGHGFQQTLMDVLIRYHRMQGKNTLWQGGTDHAGIATQMMVERQLQGQGISRHDLGRDAFVDKVWQWKKQSGQQISQQMRRMGSSIDWSRERFTLDPSLSAAVQEVFIRLYQEGLIYRGKRLVNWDPVLLTAISDLEVVSNEEQGHLWYIRYPLVNGQGFITIATTRPETLLGDTAVAVHPEDSRYQHLVGQALHLPLTGRQIPIIIDDAVDPEFGTGCVKLTPAHDFNDYAMAQRHKLPLINILTPTAHINENAPLAYQGLERFAARAKIIEDLQSQGLLEKTENHVLKIPRGDRSNAVIEPLLTDQWFVNAKALAKPAIEAVQKGHIRFVPENWSKTYFQWLENIEDWCISRQLWWGHRIPAWYDQDGNIYVGHNEAEIRQENHLPVDCKLTQDPDVLDTWFSSALWPFSTLGWPEQTPELKAFYPTSVLITGFDIIFFWVARMVMFGLKFTEQVPFKEIYITGLIRDAEGQKMSKTKGNVLDPIDLIDGISLDDLIQKRTQGLLQANLAKKIEQATKQQFPQGIPSYGTDALRFTFCALATTGRDIRFDLGRIEGYRNFCNKLWNAARYVLMNVTSVEESQTAHNDHYTHIEKWIWGRLQITTNTLHKHLQEYRFDLAAQCIYEFIWNDYCDWYIELSKFQLRASPEIQQAARYTLIHILENILHLLHPFMPFITEAIWQQVATILHFQGKTIMLQPYPKAQEDKTDSNVYREIIWLQNVISTVRNFCRDMAIPKDKNIDVYFPNTQFIQNSWHRYELMLSGMLRIANIRLGPPPTGSTTLIAGDSEIHIPLQGLIDTKAESQRLQKEIDNIQRELQRSKTKLDNPDYVHKAPPAVVAKEQQRVVELQQQLHTLENQLTQMQAS